MTCSSSGYTTIRTTLDSSTTTARSTWQTFVGVSTRSPPRRSPECLPVGRIEAAWRSTQRTPVTGSAFERPVCTPALRQLGRPAGPGSAPPSHRSRGARPGAARLAGSRGQNPSRHLERSTSRREPGGRGSLGLGRPITRVEIGRYRYNGRFEAAPAGRAQSEVELRHVVEVSETHFRSLPPPGSRAIECAVSWPKTITRSPTRDGSSANLNPAITESHLANHTDPAADHGQLERITTAVEPGDRTQAIGSAKAPIGSTAKRVLRELSQDIDDKLELPDLVRRAQHALSIHPSSAVAGPMAPSRSKDSGRGVDDRHKYRRPPGGRRTV